ncbi:MAG: DUF1007 family protein [Gammaproteobacteria bacterium]|nr:DUF1007 family protein [Gammaproteobacteria bacterium]
MKGFAWIFLLLIALPQWVNSHPHGWIDIRVNVVMNEAGQLAALEQRWKMDPFYSLALIEELNLLGATGKSEALRLMADEIQQNLTAEQYNTEAEINDTRLAFGPVETYELAEIEQQIVFMFTLPLSTPISMQAATLQYQIFEPTYFLEMLHEEDRNQPIPEALTVTGPLQCETRIIAADPDPALVMEAAELGIDEEGEHGLGRFFADTGEVVCQ